MRRISAQRLSRSANLVVYYGNSHFHNCIFLMLTASFETSKRLANAGFPQPQKEAGQFWFAFDDKLCIIESFSYSHKILCVRRIVDFKWHFIENSDISFFAPSALDVLAQMPLHTTLRKVGEDWACRYPITQNAMAFDEAYHECPHEACAEAWIKLHNLENEW